MRGLIEYLFPSSSPVTYAASSLLYPGVLIPSDTVVVGFAKDYQDIDTRIYLEYGIGQEKYFLIFKTHQSSRQVRRPEQPDFAATSEEFHSLKEGVDQHCIYLFAKTAADQLLQRLDAIFFGKSEDVLDNTTAYSNAIEAGGCRSIVTVQPEVTAMDDADAGEQQTRYGANV